MTNTDLAFTEFSNLRVAIVHYWFVGRAGGERVVESIAELFPQADLYCLVAEQSELAPVLRGRKLYTSFLQSIPGARKFHRHFLLLQPLALEQFDLNAYDLVISSESGPAKGVITSSRTCHICYCHSPMRYVWEMYPMYRRGMNPLVGTVFALVAHYMRLWDVASSRRVDYFIANSQYIAGRIRKHYGRESVVIHPPVDVRSASIDQQKGDYYLAIGRLVDYKRFDLAIDACTKLGRRLLVIGVGPEYQKLKRSAGPMIEFLGKLSDSDVRENLAACRALLFPGEEDFGIVPVEAQTFGKPVIAYASGGALETVRASSEGESMDASPTGVFFTNPSADSLVNAILEFESKEAQFNPHSIREHALQFDSQVFQKRMTEFIHFALTDFENKRLGRKTT
jgi:glycosyltransferase involved in cell wall biosynthesis